MVTIDKINNTKDQVSMIINSLIDIIKYPNLTIENSSYFYHHTARKNFIVYLYIFKLIINDNDYLESKYNSYLSRYSKTIPFSLSSITNIECKNELELLLTIKNKISFNKYDYNEEENRLYFNDDTYIDVKWYLTFLSMLLDNSIKDENKEINICYTIPHKDINKVQDQNDKDKFLSQFQYYSIRVKHTDQSKPIRENNILIVKNAAINYLKHLKQYKHGLENAESYQIFYNLLKNECRKDGFELEENEICLLDIDSKLLAKVNDLIDENFYELQLSKQVQLIENIIWQSSNDITLLEHLNNSIDSVIDFLTVINLNNKNTYQQIVKENSFNELQVLLILIVNQFLLTYLNNDDELDYSLLNLKNIKPKYMNSICHQKEQDIKTHIKSLNIDLQSVKKSLELHKAERNSLNKDELGQDKYQKELERCVGNINSASITIGRLNSNLASLSKEYEDLKKFQELKYHNVDIYNYNHSIIEHLCNSILGCSYYLKTNNTRSIFNNIIIFEDYEKTDNSFYLEVSFKDLLKISNQYILNGIIDQFDLPKLA